YALGKKEYGTKMSTAELIATFVLTVLGILAVFGVYGNWLGLQDALGIDGNTLLVAVVPLIVVTFIVYFVVRSDINKKEIKN
ncbi:hypothetical protein, partial [Bacillus cereus]